MSENDALGYSESTDTSKIGQKTSEKKKQFSEKMQLSSKIIALQKYSGKIDVTCRNLIKVEEYHE
jgi:hypothetical protein